MDRVLSFARFQISSLYKAIGAFYVSVLIIALLTGILGWTVEANSGVLVLLFILGLNCFKTSYLFAQANNISRRSFYFATILGIIALAVIASCVDILFAVLLKGVMSYKTVSLFDYYQMGLFLKIILTIAMLILVGNLGWMINMIYYRSNTLMKVLVSLSPLAAISVFNYLNGQTEGRIASSVTKFVLNALGFRGPMPNPYTALVSFTVASLLILALNFALMYKTPVKAR